MACNFFASFTKYVLRAIGLSKSFDEEATPPALGTDHNGRSLAG
jgi:hypothetical protein